MKEKKPELLDEQLLDDYQSLSQDAPEQTDTASPDNMSLPNTELDTSHTDTSDQSNKTTQHPTQGTALSQEINTPSDRDQDSIEKSTLPKTTDTDRDINISESAKDHVTINSNDNDTEQVESHDSVNRRTFGEDDITDAPSKDGTTTVSDKDKTSVTPTASGSASSDTPSSHNVNRRRYAGSYDIQNEQVHVKDSPQYFPTAFYAGFWVRTFAYLFDLWVVNLIHGILTNVLWTRIFGANVGFTWMDLAGYMVTMILYFVLTNLLLNGQTLGKILFGLRVVSLKNDRLDLWTILIREGFGRIIFHYLFFLMFTLVFSDKKQHFVDMLSDTSVVNLRYIDGVHEYLDQHPTPRPLPEHS